jgi:hypothetical protein
LSSERLIKVREIELNRQSRQSSAVEISLQHFEASGSSASLSEAAEESWR